MLASFFHLHPDPEPWIERLLARWLWRGWVHGYGRSGQTPALRQAVRTVHPTRRKPAVAPSAYKAVESLLSAVQADPPPFFDPHGFRTDSASGRLSLLALVQLHPRGPNGDLVDPAAEIERFGVEAITDLVPGHRGNLAARGFWPKDAAGPTGLEPQVILTSQGIDADTAHALAVGDVPGFLSRRAATLEGHITQFLTSRVEPGAQVRPPLVDLFVPDDDGDEVP